MKKATSIALIAGAAVGIPAFFLTRRFVQKKQQPSDDSKPKNTAVPAPETEPATEPVIFINELQKKHPANPAYAEEIPVDLSTYKKVEHEKLSYPGLLAPNGQILYNFKDENNLIFCDETQLGKRLIQLENSINIRDIGGYTGKDGRKIKWRKVIRSEELAHLSDRDVDYFGALRLKHVFDFRNKAKSERQVDRLPKTAQYHLLPVFSGAELKIDDFDFTRPGTVDSFMRSVYQTQTESRAHCFAEVLKYLTEPSEFPILYHCTNGKDRTGFMTYLILSILGVPEDVILSDYTLTNLTFDESFKLLGNIMSEELGIENYHLWEFYGVKPQWLKQSMDYINTNFGNVETYLMEETDLRENDFEKIRNNLLAK
jgi:protein-tyrosine phosphatase